MKILLDHQLGRVQMTCATAGLISYLLISYVSQAFWTIDT